MRKLCLLSVHMYSRDILLLFYYSSHSTRSHNYNSIFCKIIIIRLRATLLHFNEASSSKGICLPGRLGQLGEESDGGNDR